MSLPPIPIFDMMLGVALVVAITYSFLAERGRIARDKVEADLVTGEGVIG